MGTTVKTEFVAGVTTFMTMAYIIFVQPTILAYCGMDFGAVMVATCVASAIACFLMAILANYPISAFLTIILTITVMPFCGFSITEGISFGFISYTILMLVTGRSREVHALIYIF